MSDDRIKNLNHISPEMTIKQLRNLRLNFDDRFMLSDTFPLAL